MKLFLKGPESTIYNIFKWMSMTLQFACEVLIMTATIPGGKTHICGHVCMPRKHFKPRGLNLIVCNPEKSVLSSSLLD